MDSDVKEVLDALSGPVSNWATALTLAHLRIPRIEMMAYDDLNEAYHFEVKLVIDKALTAFAATTWPVADQYGPSGVAKYEM